MNRLIGLVDHGDVRPAEEALGDTREAPSPRLVGKEEAVLRIPPFGELAALGEQRRGRARRFGARIDERDTRPPQLGE
jgi:hypothetical protein